MEKRGLKREVLLGVIDALVKCEPLDEKHNDHNLTGNMKGKKACHVQNDWVLVYTVVGDELILYDTGSHPDVYRNM
ncbi:MAG: type II toxin-antitoxin system YafQ family toxin [Coriobacteriia bacterium]|nr:type II toxin-antitoxin system YafQ family toxin [Coriobacteriia bacterium]